MKTLKITEQLNNDYFPFFDNENGTILRSFEGFEYASVQNSIDDVAGPYGSVYVNSKHGRRQVGITGDLVGADIYTNRSLLLRALRQTGTLKLIEFTTYDDLALQFEAEVVKFVLPYTHQIHTFLIELVAPDWRFYSQELKSFDIDQTLIKGGATIPTEIPMPIDLDTSVDSEHVSILTNDGNEVTDPVITVTGPGTGFTMGNFTSDKSFVLSSTLSGGDEVIIDIKNRTVVKNGTDNLYPDITGDFWSLLPGDNELRFLVDSDATDDTNLNFTYRDAYNGI